MPMNLKRTLQGVPPHAGNVRPLERLEHGPCAVQGRLAAYMGPLGGETSVVFGHLSSLPHVQAGKMRALAVLSKKRLAAAPDVPTTAELGMPELVMESESVRWRPVIQAGNITAGWACP